MANPYQSPSTDIASELRRSGAPLWLDWAMALSAVVAAVWTFATLAYDASEEPFVGTYDMVDWLVMFVGGAIGTLFWIGWACFVLWAVARRWWHISMIVLLLFAISATYVHGWCFTRYLGDRQGAVKMQVMP